MSLTQEESNQQEEPKKKASEKKTVEDIKKIPNTLWKFVISIFSFKQDEDVNPVEVSLSIEKSVEFRGYNVWVLICSIFIACIGLNLNSPAVIIGAMLISPLMGPIRGIGLAVGTNNFKLLVFSLINLGVATGVSIAVSFIYFKLTPFKQETPEILDRVETQILSVLIAFFGGLAGIIAASKNDNSTVVPGVAIATALMPPLCVAGYGLATGHYVDYFLGALYLFLINSIFICLTTIIVIRYLKFPLVSYLNKQKERKIKTYIGVFLLIILIPSGIKFASIWNKSSFNANIENFILSDINPLTKSNGLSIVGRDIDYDNRSIILSIVGKSNISEARIRELRDKLETIEPTCNFEIIQNEIKQDVINQEYVNNLTKGYNKMIVDRDKEILELSKKLNTNVGRALDMDKTEGTLKLITEFDKLKAFSASNAYVIKMNNTIDTVLQFRATWQDSTLNSVRTKKLKDFIKNQFETNSFELIETLN